KRVLPCIRAFQRLYAARPDTALLIAGDAVSTDLARLLKIEAAHTGIRRLAHLNKRDFRLAARSVDCCLNLRYPGAGETSGIAIRLMGMGKPVIVSDNPENSALPATAALRVMPGVSETAELLDQMLLMTEFPALRRMV